MPAFFVGAASKHRKSWPIDRPPWVVGFARGGRIVTAGLAEDRSLADIPIPYSRNHHSMAVDPYQPCPCGSGKKIKFCCHDLIGELEKIYRMLEGDQPRAALRHVEQTLSKFPGRSSLLDLKASLQMSLGQEDEARNTIREFLAVEPNNPLPHAFDAMIKAEDDDATGALDAMQTAMDLCDNLVPLRLAESTSNVVGALLRADDLFAARNLLWLVDDITPYDDDRALDAIKKLDRDLHVSHLLRDRYVLRSLPKNHPAAGEMDRINQLGDNGRWRAAAELCDEILPDHLDVPLFIYNRALLSGFLGDTKNCVAGLRLYARQAIPLGDAVVAEAIALLLDPATIAASARAEVVREIVDEEAFHQQLAAHPHVVDNPQPAHNPHSEGPLPQKHYTLLDRPVPEDVENLTLDQVPRHLLSIIFYGRQTDQPPRILLLGSLESELAPRIELLESILGDSLGQELSHTSDRSGNLFVDEPADDYIFPPATTRIVYTQLRSVARDQQIRQWPATPHPLLAGKPPREAISDPDLRLPAIACFLALTQSIDTDLHAEAIASAKQELEWPEFEPIDLSQSDIDSLPLASLPRLDLSLPPSDQLLRFHRRALVAQHAPALRRTAAALIERDDIDKQTKQALQTELIFAEGSLEQSLIRLDQVRAEAKAAGESLATWDLLEFRLSIIHGSMSRAQELITYLNEEYPDDPEVMKTLQDFFMMMGAYAQSIRDPENNHHPHHPDELLPAGEPTGRVWTPSGDSSSASGGSKLWIPD